VNIRRSLVGVFTRFESPTDVERGVGSSRRPGDQGHEGPVHVTSLSAQQFEKPSITL
jgi:hypothetical protein